MNIPQILFLIYEVGVLICYLLVFKFFNWNKDVKLAPIYFVCLLPTVLNPVILIVLILKGVI